MGEAGIHGWLHSAAAKTNGKAQPQHTHHWMRWTWWKQHQFLSREPGTSVLLQTELIQSSNATRARIKCTAMPRDQKRSQAQWSCRMRSLRHLWCIQELIHPQCSSLKCCVAAGTPERNAKDIIEEVQCLQRHNQQGLLLGYQHLQM